MNQFQRIRHAFMAMFAPITANDPGSITVDVEMVNGEFRVYTQVTRGDKYMSRQDRVTFDDKNHMVVWRAVEVPHPGKPGEYTWEGDWEVMARIPMFCNPEVK